MLVKMLLSLLACANLSGCWSKVEVNDRAFTTGIYVDLAEKDQLEVGLVFPLPNRLEGTQKGGGTGGNPYAMVVKTGVDMPSAIYKTQTDLSRQISWGHVRIIVVGEELAQAGITRVLEHAIRMPSFHIKTFFFVAPKALPVAYLTPVFERFPAEVVREFMNQGSIVNGRVKELLDHMSTGGDSIVPILTINQSKMVSEKGRTGAWIGTDGAALFRYDRMIGRLDREEMQTAMWIKGEIKKSYITIPSPSDGKPITAYVIRADSKVKPTFGKDGPTIRIAVHAELAIRSTASLLDITTPGNIRMVEQAYEANLKKQIEQVLVKTKSYGVDPFQFGQLINWRRPDIWKSLEDDWRGYYRDKLQFKVDTATVIRRSGSEKNPFYNKDRYRKES